MTIIPRTFTPSMQSLKRSLISLAGLFSRAPCRQERWEWSLNGVPFIRKNYFLFGKR